MYDTQLESLMVAASRHDTCEWYDDWLYHTVTASSLSSVVWLWWPVTVPWLTVPTTDYDTSWSNVTDQQCHTTPACQHTVYPTSERVPIDPKSQEKKICRKLWSQQVKPPLPEICLSLIDHISLLICKLVKKHRQANFRQLGLTFGPIWTPKKKVRISTWICDFQGNLTQKFFVR